MGTYPTIPPKPGNPPRHPAKRPLPPDDDDVTYLLAICRGDRALCDELRVTVAEVADESGIPFREVAEILAGAAARWSAGVTWLALTKQDILNRCPAMRAWEDHMYEVERDR